MKRILLTVLLGLLLVSAAWAVPQPQEQVEKMIKSVLDVLQKPDLTANEKKEQVSGKVQEFLNIASMSQRTLGSYWQGATEEQRQRFSELFVKVLEGTYLNRIGDYTDGTVQYLKQRVKGDKAIIDTQIVAEDLAIPVQYKMILVNDVWQVFDVVIEGVSLIRNYRASYGEIIRKDGYDGLFALMEQKVIDLNGSY
ncbi:phospholipid-binding protein MlaC [Malonomonas rubra]|uniref:MlaC/ttg2D family ABC transporter substrate-binding protein n=1 Tax=Malonomonas rubra TaxID=57040 RepID=UPI0026EC950C|nr:ABC transporter substrate-binding protein [Malonomonas rubra]